MKKERELYYRSIIGVIFLMLVAILSGCISLGGKKVEIVEYNVTTHWGIIESYSVKDYSKPGFYHDIPKNASPSHTYYKISGIVKNTAGEMLKEISIDAIFYDANGTELFRSDDPMMSLQGIVSGATIYNLPKGYSENFDIIVYKSRGMHECKYFDKVASFKFVISTL